MRRSLPVSVVFGVLAAFSLASAEDGGASPSRLALERVDELAEERSPRVVAARAARDAAATYAALGRQTRARNPSLGLRAMVGVPDAPAATYAAALVIPFDGSRRRAMWGHEAEAILATAEAELLVALNEARAEARAAFVEVAVATAAIDVATDRVAVIRGLLGRVEARLASQAATAYDLALAERELAEAEGDLLAAHAALEASRGRLRQALGLSATASFDVEPLPPPGVPEGLSPESAARMAAAERREPVAYREQSERFVWAGRRLRAEAFDPLAVALEWESQGNQGTQSTFGASVSVALPVLFSNQGERAVARGQVELAGTLAEVARGTAEREATTAYAVLVYATRELAVLDERALPAAERAVDATEARLVAGATDFFQVLLNRRDLYALRARRLAVLRDAWLARVGLERALGRRLE